ncbi:MAG: RNA polymerase sigma factor [Chthoniobacter sp.]|nr:RNA polymerase sigma factor [Chthoniobacter sp.]
MADTLSSQSIEELVQQTHEGNEEAARILLQHLYPTVLKFVRSHRPKRTSEEDLCQMIFVRIFQRLPQWSRKAPLEHWVSRIAINTCINQIEFERIRPELRYADLSEDQVAVVENLRSCEADLPPIHDTAAHELLDTLLSRLKPKDRLIITLMHIEERPVAEISALTGWSGTSVKVRAFRARQRLKRLYAQVTSPT